MNVQDQLKTIEVSALISCKPLFVMFLYEISTQN
jgi:hypothetical protein